MIYCIIPITVRLLSYSLLPQIIHLCLINPVAYFLDSLLSYYWKSVYTEFLYLFYLDTKDLVSKAGIYSVLFSF